MNCREFERTILDLGDEHLSHAATCADCAARLGREKRLTSGLRALATEEATIDAPDRVLAALRNARNKPQAIVFESRRRRRRLLWGLAAAAVLLMTMTFAVWLRRPAPGNGRAITHHPPSRPNPSPALETRIATQPASEKIRRRPVGGRRRPGDPVNSHAQEALFPLTYVARSGPEEFIQTVRVEISRATLQSMGLLINLDRGDGMIRADLIIGEDGVARAVRLIK
jgi:hypothetical protein